MSQRPTTLNRRVISRRHVISSFHAASSHTASSSALPSPARCPGRPRPSPPYRAARGTQSLLAAGSHSAGRAAAPCSVKSAPPAVASPSPLHRPAASSAGPVSGPASTAGEHRTSRQPEEGPRLLAHATAGPTPSPVSTAGTCTRAPPGPGDGSTTRNGLHATGSVEPALRGPKAPARHDPRTPLSRTPSLETPSGHGSRTAAATRTHLVSTSVDSDACAVGRDSDIAFNAVGLRGPKGRDSDQRTQTAPRAQDCCRHSAAGPRPAAVPQARSEARRRVSSVHRGLSRGPGPPARASP